jgi:hypothetical protein
MECGASGAGGMVWGLQLMIVGALGSIFEERYDERNPNFRS